jgi:hypothetical protein
MKGLAQKIRLIEQVRQDDDNASYQLFSRAFGCYYFSKESLNCLNSRGTEEGRNSINNISR